MDFVFTITTAVLLAVTIGVVEIFKQLGVDKRWCPLIALVVGVLLTVGLAFFDATFTVVVTGLTIGLSAVGLYSGVRATIGK